MKSLYRSLILVFLLVLTGTACAQFDSGSDGSYGPLVVTASDPTTVTIDLPADGIIRATTVSIAHGRQLRFNRNQLNTPVVILAQGDVDIIGSIDVSGGVGTSSVGGLGGPGGFDGGTPGGPEFPPGAGFGPGAGLPGSRNNADAGAAGGGSFATKPSTSPNAQDGDVYGNPLLIPLIGGSGGGGTDSVGGNPQGGSGGGGAILIASNTRIDLTTLSAFNGAINAEGGGANDNGGAGGGVRLVAPVVEGNGAISVRGSNGGGNGGNGRVRIDTLDRQNMSFSILPGGSTLSMGSAMVAIPDVVPQLDIISAAGQNIPVGSGPVTVTLPPGSDTNQDVVVQAADFGSVMVDIEVVVTPQYGSRAAYPGTIDLTGGSPAQVTVPVQIPLNTEVFINAWSK